MLQGIPSLKTFSIVHYRDGELDTLNHLWLNISINDSSTDVLLSNLTSLIYCTFFILEKDNIRYPPSAHYPTRQSIMTQFANLFVKYGAAIPDVAFRGIFNDIPLTLQPPSKNIDVIRPEHTSKYRVFVYTVFGILRIMYRFYLYR